MTKESNHGSQQGRDVDDFMQEIGADADMGKAAAQLARTAAMFHAKLVQKGISPDAATALTAVYLQGLFGLYAAKATR